MILVREVHHDILTGCVCVQARCQANEVLFAHDLGSARADDVLAILLDELQIQLLLILLMNVAVGVFLWVRSPGNLVMEAALDA